MWNFDGKEQPLEGWFMVIKIINAVFLALVVWDFAGGSTETYYYAALGFSYLLMIWVLNAMLKEKTNDSK